MSDYDIRPVQVTKNVRYEPDGVLGGFTVVCGFHGRVGNRTTDGEAEALAHRHAAHKHEAQRGQALVELGLVSIVLMFLLVGALDLGRLFYSNIVIANAAKEAALVASRGGTFVPAANCSATNTVMCAAITEAQGGLVTLKPADVTATTCPAKPTAATPPVSATTKTRFKSLTPVIAWAVGGSDIELSHTAKSPCAYTPTVTLGSAPTPTPAPCEVPKFIGMKANSAAKAWTDAGFVATNLTIVRPPTGNPNIVSEDPASSDETEQVCATFKLKVTAP